MLLSGVLFVLFLAGCWLYCLTDAALTPAWEYRGRLRKNAWICIIAATFIVGAIAWLITRRTRRTRSLVIPQARRGRRRGRAAADRTWPAWTAAEAAARHPAGRSRQAPPGNGKLPTGPDDDPEFLRQLDRRIRGTSTDPGELSTAVRWVRRFWDEEPIPADEINDYEPLPEDAFEQVWRAARRHLEE